MCKNSVKIVEIESKTASTVSKSRSRFEDLAGPSAAVWRMQTWLQAGIGDLGRTLVPHTHRGELGCARWTAEHDDCRNTEITRDAQEWQVSRRETFGACCGCLAAAFWCESSIRYPGRWQESEGKRDADGSCVNVTGHAVTNELGEEIVAAGERVWKI